MFSERRAAALVGIGVVAFIFQDELSAFWDTLHTSLADASGLDGIQTPAVEGTACAPHPGHLPYDLDKPVATPDVELADAKGWQTIKDNDGWFITNRGTAANPDYQLFRLTGYTLRAGPHIPDLSLLGPQSIPEVNFHDVVNRDDQFQLISEKVTEKEMRVFYQMPNYPSYRLTEQYWARFNARVDAFGKPLVFDPARGLSIAEIERLRDTVLDSTVAYDEQPTEMQAAGQCTQRIYADVTNIDPKRPGEFIMRQYPLSDGTSREVREWLLAHETGHALDRVLNFQDDFNRLPSWQRATILMQLEHFQEYLQRVGKPYNGVSTSQEALADALSYFLRDPALVKAQAPDVYEFFIKQINSDRVLSRIIQVRPTLVS